MSKQEFIDMHQHHKDDVDLGAEYDKVVGPKATAKVEPKVEVKVELKEEPKTEPKTEQK